MVSAFTTDNTARVVVFKARKHLALTEDVVAVPFALVKLLAAKLSESEANAELQAAGMPINVGGKPT